MSWSVSAVGKPPAVRASIAERFTRNKCSEPEESIRQAAAAIIDKAIEAQGDKVALQVDASGSQSADYSTQPPTVGSNTLHIKLQPIYGFVE